MCEKIIINRVDNKQCFSHLKYLITYSHNIFYYNVGYRWLLMYLLRFNYIFRRHVLQFYIHIKIKYSPASTMCCNVGNRFFTLMLTCFKVITYASTAYLTMFLLINRPLSSWNKQYRYELVLYGLNSQYIK